MPLTGQQYLDNLSNRVLSIRRRFEELDRIWVSMVQDSNVYAQQHGMPVKDSTASSLRAWYNFDAHWGPQIKPYIDRLRTAVLEAQTAVNQAERVTVITEAQIEAADELIEEANRWIQRGQTFARNFRNSQMGRITQATSTELGLSLITGVGWGTVISQRANDTAQTIRAANEAMTRVVRAAAEGPSALQYGIALAAFTAAGYLWFKVLR
jgi:hypothetical protein